MTNPEVSHPAFWERLYALERQGWELGQPAPPLVAYLEPGGWFLACFYPIRDGGGGPPFPVSKEEVRRLFQPAFHLEEERDPDHSAERRRGQEWLVRAVKPPRVSPREEADDGRGDLS